MPRVNKAGNPSTSRRIDHSHSPSKRLLEAAKFSKTQTSKPEPTLKELGGLFFEMIAGLPGAAAHGVGNVIRAYVTSFKEAGIGAIVLFQDGIQTAKAKISEWKNPKPAENEQEAIPTIVTTKKKRRRIYDSGPIVITPKKRHKIRGSGWRSRPKKIETPSLNPAYEILKLDDKSLIENLFIRFSELPSDHNIEKLVATLEGTCMSIPFTDLMPMFSEKKHLSKEDLKDIAREKLIMIMDKEFHDINLSTRLVERIINANSDTSSEAEVQECLRFQDARKEALIKEFQEFSEIKKFIDIASGPEDLNRREGYLQSLRDIKLVPKSLDLEYKNYLDYTRFKKSKDTTYTFYLGRIDQELRKTDDPLVNNFTARKQLAEVLACHEISNDGVIEFTNKVVEIASHKISGAGKVIEKLHRNINNNSFYGHLVEATNICRLFNLLTEDERVTLQASKESKGCDIDAYFETLDGSGNKINCFVEIKTSIGVAHASKDQMKRLTKNLSNNEKLIYLIDNLTEGFIQRIENYNEINKLRDLASNEKIEVWLNDGTNVTEKLRRKLGIRLPKAA